MRLYRLLLAGIFSGIFATTALAAPSDPFVGTWVFNAEKSPKPTVTYAIKDLGGDRYALTGSAGETTEIKADGVSIKSPSGATVSFQKLDDHTWQMDRVTTQTMKRTYTVSSDDRTLTLVDMFTGQGDVKAKSTTTYARTSPGKSIFGEWKSVSIEEEFSGPPVKVIIAPFGKDGLSFTSTSDKDRTDMKFDGKQYFEMGPDGRTGDSSAGKRIGDRVIQMESETKGKPDSKDEFKVSEDGKTLTVVSKAVKTSAVFTMIYDKE